MEILKNIPTTINFQKKLQQNFPKLFWDIDTHRLDIRDHYKLIITQAINYGSVEIIKQIFQIYTHETIKEILEHPIRGVWFPKTYKAFCNLFDIVPNSSAINIMCIRKGEPRGKIKKFFKKL